SDRRGMNHSSRHRKQSGLAGWIKERSATIHPFGEFPREKKGAPKDSRSVVGRSDHATRFPLGARLILPAFRQRVHTLTFWIRPSSSIRTTWRFGRHVRRVLLFACDTLLPNATPLPQT